METCVYCGNDSGDEDDIQWVFEHLDDGDPVCPECWEKRGYGSTKVVDQLRAELAEAKARDESLPDDLREKGWMVAVHNDYRINGERKTFWLLTYDDGQYVKGEGATDAEALNEIRAFLGAKEGK